MIIGFELVSGLRCGAKFGVSLTLKEIFNRNIDFSHVSGILTDFQSKIDNNGNVEGYVARFIIDSDIKGFNDLHFENCIFESEINSRVLYFPDSNSIDTDNALDCYVYLGREFIHGIDVLNNPKIQIKAVLALAEEDYLVTYDCMRAEIVFCVTDMTVES